MKETVTLNSREIQRIQVLERICRGAMTLVEAVPLLLVCYRQAKRLLDSGELPCFPVIHSP